jgi:hypothetical protein
MVFKQSGAVGALPQASAPLSEKNYELGFYEQDLTVDAVEYSYRVFPQA